MDLDLPQNYQRCPLAPNENWITRLSQQRYQKNEELGRARLEKQFFSFCIERWVLLPNSSDAEPAIHGILICHLHSVVMLDKIYFF